MFCHFGPLPFICLLILSSLPEVCGSEPAIICNRDLIRRIIVVCGLEKRSTRKQDQLHRLPLLQESLTSGSGDEISLVPPVVTSTHRHQRSASISFDQLAVLCCQRGCTSKDIREICYHL